VDSVKGGQLRQKKTADKSSNPPKERRVKNPADKSSKKNGGQVPLIFNLLRLNFYLLSI